MSTNTEKKPVVVAKRACPVCAKTFDGEILIAKNLQTDLSKMNGQVIGYLDKPCDQCQEWMKQGVIFVGTDPDKTEDKNNPWRTGDFSVIKDTSRVFDVINEPQRSAILEKRVCFIDYRTGYKLGVFRHPEEMQEPTNPDAED
jgi:hypothetical protein